MARIVEYPQKTFSTMLRIRETALVRFDSLFSPGRKLWDLAHLQQFHSLFGGRLDAGEGSFLDKFRKQLAGASDDILQLAAELLYVQQWFTSVNSILVAGRRPKSTISFAGVSKTLPPLKHLRHNFPALCYCPNRAPHPIRHKERTSPTTDPLVAPKTAPRPITTRQLAYALAEQHQLSKKQGLEMVEDLVGLVIKHLKRGERVKIAGLGILQVRTRAARLGRNPKTGEPSRSRLQKRSPSAPARSSRRRSNRRFRRPGPCVPRRSPPIAGSQKLDVAGPLAGTSGSRLELISKDHARQAPAGRRAVELFLRKYHGKKKPIEQSIPRSKEFSGKSKKTIE
jgi:DNA-binding protein HU-beta